MFYSLYHLDVLIRHFACFNPLLFETSTMGFFHSMFRNGPNDDDGDIVPISTILGSTTQLEYA